MHPSSAGVRLGFPRLVIHPSSVFPSKSRIHPAAFSCAVSSLSPAAGAAGSLSGRVTTNRRVRPSGGWTDTSAGGNDPRSQARYVASADSPATITTEYRGASGFTPAATTAVASWANVSLPTFAEAVPKLAGRADANRQGPAFLTRRPTS